MTTATIAKTKKTSKKVIPYYSKRSVKTPTRAPKMAQAPVIVSSVVLEANYDSLRIELKRRLHVANIDIKRINKTLKLIKHL